MITGANNSTTQAALTAAYTDFACMKAPATIAPVGEAFRYVHDTESQNNFLE